MIIIKRNTKAAEAVFQSELNRLIQEITQYADNGISKLQLSFRVCSSTDAEKLVEELKKLNLLISNVLFDEIPNAGVCCNFNCFIRG